MNVFVFIITFPPQSHQTQNIYFKKNSGRDWVQSIFVPIAYTADYVRRRQ